MIVLNNCLEITITLLQCLQSNKTSTFSLKMQFQFKELTNHMLVLLNSSVNIKQKSCFKTLSMNTRTKVKSLHILSKRDTSCSNHQLINSRLRIQPLDVKIQLFGYVTTRPHKLQIRKLCRPQQLKDIQKLLVHISIHRLFLKFQLGFAKISRKRYSKYSRMQQQSKTNSYRTYILPKKKNRRQALAKPLITTITN